MAAYGLWAKNDLCRDSLMSHTDMTLQSASQSASTIEARPKRRRPRRKRETACDYCKLKKIRCNRANAASCANCLDRGQSCITVGLPQKNLNGQGAISRAIAPRTRLESPQEGPSRPVKATKTLTTLDSLANAASSFDSMATVVPIDYQGLNATDMQSSLARDAFMPSPTHDFDIRCERLEIIAPVEDNSPKGANNETSILPPDLGLLSQTEGSFEDVGLSSNESNNWEYHGPRSCLSLCSQSGIAWVESRTGSQGFRSSAQKLTSDITRRLKISSQPSMRLVPDPDPTTAWNYTSAYFQHALDASMGVVQRSTFESQLTSYLNGVTNHVDVAWHALRNAIYASGCRIYLSETQSFHEANRVAWTYFENALAFYTQILLFRTSLTSVQALTVMAYYSQNFGSPCLEYMLCNNALALANGRGLHRKPTQGWNLTPAERSHRSCIFWALYCLEKQIEKQSGRPSTINDDEVTCELPELSSAPNESLNLTYLTLLVKLSRFASVVTRQLSSVRVICLGAQELVSLIARLDEQLSTLRSSLEPTITLGGAMNPNRLPPGLTLQQAVYLYCFYHTIVLDIHSTLIYPWSKTLLGLTPQRVLRTQVETSVETVLRACHTVMLTLNYVHIDAATPVPLSFVTPVYVLTNLFICIIQNPAHQQVSTALSLMELGAAFFTRLHVASDAAVPMEFAKELTALAKETSQKFNSSTSPIIGGNDRTNYGSEAPALSTAPRTTTDPPCDYHTPTFAIPDQSEDMVSRDELDSLEFEQWSILIPADVDLDGIDFPMPVGSDLIGAQAG